MQFDFILDLAGPSQGDEALSLGERRIRLFLVRNPRARCYAPPTAPGPFCTNLAAIQMRPKALQGNGETSARSALFGLGK